MSNKQRNAEGQAWRDQNKRIREWLLQHPARVQNGMWHVSINLTEVLEAELDREMKNARRAGRTSLRNRLKCLVMSIISYRFSGRKGARA